MPRAVIAQVVGAKPAESANVYSGEVRARYENDLAFRVGGKVVARYVDVGAPVTRGQALARLDPQDAQLGVDAARSQLAAAAADHDLAAAEVERYRDLYARKFVSQAVLDARETTFNTTKARLAQAKAQVSTARNQSAYTTLVAEADGVITAVNLEPGQVVAPGQAVMRFARPDEKEVVISVPESRLAELRDARNILISVLADPDRAYRGRIREIAPTADPATRTFAVKVTVLEANGTVRLGMTANVALGDRAGDPIITLPLTALTQLEGKPAVWVFDPGSSKVNLRPVVIGAYREDGVIVREGLRPGEIVVTVGVHKLLPDETVRVVSETLASPRSQQRLEAAVRNGV
jgi:multidrug efflux system membrane fusion protein